MFDSAVFDVVVGLVFLLATFSVAVSALTEGVSRLLGLRSLHLIRGIRALVDGEWDPGSTTTSTYRLFQSPFIGTAGQKHRATPQDEATAGGDEATLGGDEATPGSYEIVTTDQENFEAVISADSWKHRKVLREFPSYIASRQFASAVLSEVVPPRNEDGSKPPFSQLRTNITDTFNDSALSEMLLKIVDDVGDDVDEIRLRLETAYDDHMDRVSGWYKRHTRKFQLVFAAVVVLTFNFNLLRVADHLNDSDTTRAAVVSIAENTTCEGDPGSPESVECARTAIDSVAATNLPVMWQDVGSCALDSDDCSFAERKGIVDASWDWSDRLSWANTTNVLVIVVGYVLAWLGLVPGSRFWFDALAKLNTLRSGGKPPPKADPAAP